MSKILTGSNNGLGAYTTEGVKNNLFDLNKILTKSNQVGVEELDWSIDSISKTFRFSTCNKGESVGSITNGSENHKALSRNIEYGRAALYEFVKGINGQGKYKSLPRYTATIDNVSENKSVTINPVNRTDDIEIIKRIKACDLDDPENIKKIFDDIDKVDRMYQEVTIDAAKKQDFIEVKLVLKGYRCNALLNYDYNKAGEESYLKTKELRIQRIQGSATTIYFDDCMSITQDNCAVFLIDMINNFLKLAFKMPDAEVNRLAQYTLYPEYRDMRLMKAIYRTSTAIYTSRLVEADEINSELLRQRADEENQKVYGWIRFMSRQILSEYDEIAKASMAQCVACCDGQGAINPESTNKFAFTIMTNEFLALITKDHPERRIAGYPILNAKEDIVEGNEVSFTFGVSDKGSILDFENELEYSTGTFRIKFIDNVPYAVRDIEFKTPEINWTKRIVPVNMKTYSKDDIIEICKAGNRLSIDSFGVIYQDDVELNMSVKQDSKKFRELYYNISGTVSDFIYLEQNDFNYLLIELDDVVKDVREEEECSLLSMPTNTGFFSSDSIQTQDNSGLSFVDRDGLPISATNKNIISSTTDDATDLGLSFTTR